MKKLIGIIFPVLFLCLSAFGSEIGTIQSGKAKIKLKDGSIFSGSATANLSIRAGAIPVLIGEIEVIPETSLSSIIRSKPEFNWSAKTKMQSGGSYVEGECKAAVFVIDGFGTITYVPERGQDSSIPSWFELRPVEVFVTMKGSSGILKIKIEPLN